MFTKNGPGGKGEHRPRKSYHVRDNQQRLYYQTQSHFVWMDDILCCTLWRTKRKDKSMVPPKIKVSYSILPNTSKMEEELDSCLI